MTRKLFPVIGLLVALALASLAHAAPRLPSIFADNMVLQRDMPVPVWGWADAAEKISVKVAGQSKTTTTDAQGNWSLKLDALQPGAPLEMTIAGKSRLALKNILVGEVWICSGQSNMAFTLQGAHNAQREIARANHPRIRLFWVPPKPALQPQADCQGRWVECTPETAKNFTAVGYFFGRDLHQALDLPVGLVNTSYGGTPAQSWTSLEGLESKPSLAVFVKGYRDTVGHLDQLEARYRNEVLPRWAAAQKKWDAQYGKAYRETILKWRKEVEAAAAAGKVASPPPQPAVRPPRKPRSPQEDPNVPSTLYNAMIHPIVPLAIRGAIWYQGESNAGDPVQYRALFPAMIEDWRRVWREGDFPFLFVQLANYMKREDQPTQSALGWPGLREAQTMTLKLSKTGMALSIDIGQGDDIHPRDKADVGRRLMLAALKIAYGRDLVYSGPGYESMSVEGEKIRIKFEHVGGGLVIGAAPPTQLDQSPQTPSDHLVGFSIAGADKKFVWASAKIDGPSVLVWNDEVKRPAAVRYAWANNPECNLYNKEGLPAGPFRTDDWVALPLAGKK